MAQFKLVVVPVVVAKPLPLVVVKFHAILAAILVAASRASAIESVACWTDASEIVVAILAVIHAVSQLAVAKLPKVVRVLVVVVKSLQLVVVSQNAAVLLRSDVAYATCSAVCAIANPAAVAKPPAVASQLVVASRAVALAWANKSKTKQAIC